MFKDILSIENAADYACVIRNYSFGHSVLHVQATNNTRPPHLFYIAFYPVEYFSGPVSWKGANFAIASNEECLEVLKQLERFSNITAEKLLERPYGLKLYRVTTPKNLVQIIAMEAQVHDQGWILG